MDREKLARIDTNVQDLTVKFDRFLSSDGQFVDVKERVKVLEITTCSLKKDVKETKDKTSSLWVKASGIATVITLGGLLVILKIFGVLGG